MRLSAADQARFPRSTRYVRNTLPTVINIGSIRRAMARFGQLNRAQFARALQWGTDPLIVSVNNLGACGAFTQNNPNRISLDETIFTEYEAGRGTLHSIHGPVPALGVNILHEMTHWGDFRDGVQQRNPDGTLFEEGEAFELAVYGVNLAC